LKKYYSLFCIIIRNNNLIFITMKKLTLFLSALFTISIAQSQSVVLCGDYDKTTGVPSDVFEAWDIDAAGSYVYTVYSEEKKIKDALSLRLEKKNDSGLYEVYGTFAFNNDVKSGLNWAMFDLLFTEDGEYRVNVLGKGDVVLAATNTSIAFAPDAVSDTSYVDTYYYENSVVTFGESVDKEILIGESTVFTLENDTRKISAKLEQDEALLLTKLYVTVILGEETISDNAYDIPSKDWNYVTVPVTVNKPGSYYVDFYTQDDVFINSGSFEVE
jgi:hypothetical protein